MGESLRIKRAQKNSDVKSADHTKMNSAPKSKKQHSEKKRSHVTDDLRK